MKRAVHFNSSQPGFRIFVANASKLKSPRCLGRMLSAASCPESGAFVGLAHPAGFEPTAYRLGEPLNICHLCSPMYRKVAIRQAFFVFRVAPCSSKFTGVVRCSPVHFSSFLDFSKKGNKNIFHLPPILAHFEQKSICSRTASLNRISHISLKSTRWGRR